MCLQEIRGGRQRIIHVSHEPNAQAKDGDERPSLARRARVNQPAAKPQLRSRHAPRDEPNAYQRVVKRLARHAERL